MVSVVQNSHTFGQISIVTRFTLRERYILKHFLPALLSNRYFCDNRFANDNCSIMERFEFDPFSIFKLQIMISWNCKMASEVFRHTQICCLVGSEQLAFLQMQITSFRKQQTNYTSAAGEKRGPPSVRWVMKSWCGSVLNFLPLLLTII